MSIAAMAGLGLGSALSQYLVGQHQATQAKKQRHKQRDFMGLLLAKLAQEDKERLQEAFGEAEEQYRGSARARGSYRPDIFATKKAELGTDLQKALQRSRLGFMGQYMSNYMQQPAPVSPMFDPSPIFQGAAMGATMGGGGSKSGDMSSKGLPQPEMTSQFSDLPGMGGSQWVPKYGRFSNLMSK